MARNNDLGRIVVALSAHWAGREAFALVRKQSDPTQQLLGALALLFLGVPVASELGGHQAVAAYIAGLKSGLV